MKQVFAEAKVEPPETIIQTLFPSAILFFQKELLLNYSFKRIEGQKN